MALRRAVVFGWLIACLPVAAAYAPARATGVQQPAEAATLFSQKCSACHGSAGVPNAAMAQSLGIPNMTDPAGITTKPDSTLRVSVAAGKGKMPAFGGVLTSAQIRSLVTYVKSFRRLSHR